MLDFRVQGSSALLRPPVSHEETAACVVVFSKQVVQVPKQAHATFHWAREEGH